MPTKLIERIIFLDGNPNMQTLESLRIGRTVKEVLDRDLQAEMEARTLYEEAASLLPQPRAAFLFSHW